MYYKGKLEGINIKELKQNKKDKEEKLLSERLEVLESKYKKVGKFYEAFTSEVYNPNLKETDPLSHIINIFKYLEYDGTYLLTSEDVEMNKTTDKHITKCNYEYDQFLTQKGTKHHNNFEIAMNLISEFDSKKYINTETVIDNKDFSNNEYGEYLKQYESVRKILTNELLAMQGRQNTTELNINELNKYNHSLPQLKDLLSNYNQDMIIIKEAYTGLTKYSLKEDKQYYANPSSKLDSIDYTNENHISAIIRTVDLFQEDLNPNDSISEIAYDIRLAISKLLRKGILSEDDLSLISLIQSSDLNFEEIANILAITRKTVYNRFNKIVKKICNYHKSKEGR